MERTLKASEGLIKIGCNRILEKVKGIRQKFSTALANVKKKGSDKIVLEYFDLVKIIHGVVPAGVNYHPGTYFATESIYLYFATIYLVIEI